MDIVLAMSLWTWLLLGAGTWALAVVLKVTADLYVQRSNLPELKDWVAAGLSGLWSAACELGLFALAIWLWNAGLLQALVAAIGVGLAEMIALTPAILSGRWNRPDGRAGRQATWKAIGIERGIHFSNHLLVRTLLWMGLLGTAGPKALAAAFGLMVVTEAAQAYAQARGWNLVEPRNQRFFLSFLGTVIPIAAGLIVLWR